jgi:hypothetical protein
MQVDAPGQGGEGRRGPERSSACVLAWARHCIV